ncbi:hypothetical protein ADIS_1683 [Lunatimonas lonarensis]|uniref:Outer membrane protein beta-barrel domain-containing protein n=1 Tax=Lunatimonas lonarensis TaxID=1232681 RepID=R7ZUV5_9BACT|nr:hypothetical protein [Lunatimonas lonarensis]EON77764.1 hypothetical protein ADIS_1683 [Lunatimonas lonarensis]
MKEQFDKKLTEKIRDTFDRFEEPYDPAQWKKLSEAYFQVPAKPKRFAFIWPLVTAGIAASLLLGVVFWPRELDIDNDLEKLATRDESAVGVEESGTVTLAEPGESVVLETKESDQQISVGSPQKSSASESDRPESLSPNSSLDKVTVAQAGVEKSNDATLGSLQAGQVTEDLGVDRGSSPELPTPYKSVDPALDLAEQVPVRIEVDQAQETIDRWLSAADKAADSPVLPKQAAPVKLGVLLAPQASSDAINGMNLGAGIMSEFSLSRRMKLDIGMTYARQNLSPDMPPSVVMASSYPSRQSYQVAMVDNIRASTNYLGSSSQLSLASLDFPVNLKYMVLERKNAGIFLITGLSSMVYLDQAATETFETTSFFTSTAEGLSFVPSVEQFTSVFRPEGSGGADLGGMLNLSVGYEYNLKNGMFISLEPFYKLPLGDLTFVNQQFSVTGLNLRMNFHLKK